MFSTKIFSMKTHVVDETQQTLRNINVDVWTQIDINFVL